MTAHSLELTRAGLIAALCHAAGPGAGSAAAVGAPVDDVSRKLAAALEIYDNDDALARRQALAAAAAGRPAFWTTAGYHSQKASALQLAVHTLPTIEAALDFAYAPGAGTELRLAAFDALVPLNPMAVEALALVYARLGAWRDTNELEARSMRDTRPQHQLTHPHTVNSAGGKLAGYILDGNDDTGFHAPVKGESAARQARGKT